MRRQQLHEGDTAEIKLPYCRQPFPARIVGFDGPDVLIDPIPKWPTWRRVKLTDISERLDPPPRRHRRRRAAA